MLKKVLKQLWGDNLAIILILIGSLSWSLTMLRSGLVYDYGMGFWGPNGHDGIWHVALASSLAQGKFIMPIFSSESIQNYHIGFDLLLAVFHKITFIPIINLYFQILPVMFSLLIGFLTYIFVYKWQKNKLAALWSTFFVYFGGNFGWLVTYAREGQLGGESMFWSQQAISTLINPPFALSLIIILIILILIIKPSKKIKKQIIISLLAASLFQIKIYAGLLMLGGLFIYTALSLRHCEECQQRSNLLLFVLSLIFSLIIFLPFNYKSASVIVFAPFWFLETMMQLSDRVGWTRFGEAMLNYKYGYVYPKFIISYGVAFTILIIGNLGTRLISLFYLRNYKKLTNVDYMFWSIIIAGILMPMLFVQKGTAWNTIQFFYYSLFFVSLYSGIVISKIKSKILIILVILFTIPTAIGTLKHVYATSTPPSKLSNDEISALKFLSQQPKGVVLTYPVDYPPTKLGGVPAPMPLYRYTTTSYVAAFAGQEVFMEDEMNLDIMQYNWKPRREEIIKFYENTNDESVKSFLKQNNIKYIYWVKPQRATLGPAQLGIERIFENEEVIIHKMIK